MKPTPGKTTVAIGALVMQSSTGMRSVFMLAVLLLSGSSRAEARLEGNTVIVERPTGPLRFFAGCTAVSIVEHVRMHVACQDGRVRSYELSDDGALLVHELQLDGQNPALFVEQGRLWVRLGERVEQLFPEQVIAVLPAAPSVPAPPREPVVTPASRPSSTPRMPPEQSPRPASAPPQAPSTVTRAGRIAAELGVHVGVMVGAGLASGLLVAGVAWRPSASGLDLIAGPGLIGAGIGLGLAMLLSPLYLAPLHRSMNGRGLGTHAWLGVLAGVALSALTLPFVLPLRPGGDAAISAGISLPLMFLAPIVGLEVGDVVVSQTQLAPTVNISTTGASVGVGGRW